MKIMIRNAYFLIAGVLALLFAVTHAWNGHAAVLPALDIGAVSAETRTVFTYVWHIVTAENLVFGIAFMIMALQREQSKIRFAAWMIAAVLIVRLLVIVGATAWLDVSALSATFMDSIAILVYVALIILGTLMKQKRFAGEQVR